MRRLALVLAVTGCASLWAGHVRSSTAAMDPSRREQFWFAALHELELRGFQIDVAAPEQGLIRTAVSVRPGRVPCGLLKCSYRDTVEISLPRNGDPVSVRIDRELSIPILVLTPGAIISGEKWTPPSRWQKETLAGIEADEDELLQAILRPQSTEGGQPVRGPT